MQKMTKELAAAQQGTSKHTLSQNNNASTDLTSSLMMEEPSKRMKTSR